MLGYVRPYEPQLRIIEQQYYRGVYCGLCHALGRECGQLSRLGLSYDFTLLVLFRLAVTGEKPEFEKRRCIAHPCKKRLTAKGCQALEFSAFAGNILAYRKILDDVSDERGAKRQRAKMARSIFRGGYKRARKALPELDLFIEERLAELSELEKKKTPSVDLPAGIFGDVLAKIFAFGLEGAEKKLAEAFGQCIGRWIYIIDAVDDYEKDKEKGRYNPFLCLYGDRELDSEIKKDIEAALKTTLGDAINALDLISFEGRADLEGLLKNILLLGMPARAHKIIYGEDCESCETELKGNDK